MLTILLQWYNMILTCLNRNEAFDNHLYLHKVHAWKWIYIGRNLRRVQNGNIHVRLAINSIHAKAIQAIYLYLRLQS